MGGLPVSERVQCAGSSVVRMHREARVLQTWFRFRCVGRVGWPGGKSIRTGVQSLRPPYATGFVFLDALSDRGSVDESSTVSDAHWCNWKTVSLQSGLRLLSDDPLAGTP